MTRKTVSWIAVGIAALVLLGSHFLFASPPGLLWSLRPPDDCFFTMDLSPDGKTLATGSFMGRTVAFWDVETGKQISSLNSKSRGMSIVLYSPNGKQLFVLGRDGPARLWSLPDQNLLHTFPREGHYVHAAFIEDGETILLGLYENYEPIIAFYNTRDGSLIKETAFPAPVELGCFSQDGLYMSLRMTLRFEPRRILWNTQKGLQAKVFPLAQFNTTVAFTQDSKNLLIGSGGKISVWPIQDDEPSITYEVPGTGSLTRIAGSKDGNLILSGESGSSISRPIKEWLRTLGLDLRIPMKYIPPAGGALACGKTGKVLRTFPGHTDNIHSVAFTPDTKRAITASKDRIQIWDISDVTAEP